MDTLIEVAKIIVAYALLFSSGFCVIVAGVNRWWSS